MSERTARKSELTEDLPDARGDKDEMRPGMSANIGYMRDNFGSSPELAVEQPENYVRLSAKSS